MGVYAYASAPSLLPRIEGNLGQVRRGFECEAFERVPRLVPVLVAFLLLAVRAGPGLQWQVAQLGSMGFKAYSEKWGCPTSRAFRTGNAGTAVYFPHESDVADETAHVFESRSAKTTHQSPGFVVTRSEAQDEPGAAMYKIIVWGTIVIYASIIRSDDPVNSR
jgi:hypothetical protein